MDGIKMPPAPVVAAGGIGGPCIVYIVTPFRNGLTLGATDAKSGAVALYQQVFRGGLRAGWTGGIYPAFAACPQFLCLGPAYHIYASVLGTAGGVVLASATESAIVYGAETANAQMAANQKTPGRVANVHPSWKPWGPGLGLHIFRNVIATAGLRLFCGPCTTVVEKAAGQSNGFTQVCGDFWGNVMGACLSAPVHQMYGYTVSNPDLWTLSSTEKSARMRQFLIEQYTETVDGRRRLSAIVPRDLIMRSMYIAIAYTMYSTLERTLVAKWPKH
eukprot:TRINITY_DN41965_c0_g1_i1.p1 TRINITY_DN41965_c0_g1~~TRINITY_DN41965_c0_g1_i1.p1  ORF type:complete len:274 (-),score=40.31 TRINITY_DN41965_c0_g1_i1:326-1147(-)